MRCLVLIRLLLPLICGFSTVFICLPAAAQDRAVMQVSVSVVNTCQFGTVNSCALPGTRIVAAAATAGLVKTASSATTLPLQVLHL